MDLSPTIDKTRCIARVYGERVSSWQCTRSAGFGPDGKFCKVHGRKKEQISADKVLWCVKRKWDTTKFPVAVKVREIKGKTFIDEHGRQARLETEYERFFLSEKLALLAAIEQVSKALERARRETESNAEALDTFNKRLAAL